MECAAMITDAFGRVHGIVHRVVEDLDPSELLADPKPPIGWLVWHLARVQDSNISGLMEREQMWISEGWHRRFEMPPERRDYASGHVQTPEQVDAFRVTDKRLLMDYFDAVLERTKAYLAGLSDTDLGRVLNEPRYQPVPTVAVRLVSVVADNIRHAGQIEYLHGFLRHKGWFPGARR